MTKDEQFREKLREIDEERWARLRDFERSGLDLEKMTDAEVMRWIDDWDERYQIGKMVCRPGVTEWVESGGPLLN